jgi:mannan endo-1,4-beta-mannosidase
MGAALRTQRGAWQPMNARTVRNVLVVSTLALATVLGRGVSADARTSAAPQLPRFLWGAWIGDQFTGQQPPWDWKAATDFEAANSGGRHISALHWGVGEAWDHDFNYWRGALNAAQYAGALSLVDMDTGSVPLHAIASGAEDSALHEWATEAASWGEPLLLRFDWEMNGGWYPWGTKAGKTSNTPAAFVAAWRHVHELFTNAGATNVLWVWCPNIDPKYRNAPLSRLYPGNSYVDWTCLDGYNWGAPWTSFTKLYANTYRRIARLAPRKPMIIGEVASSGRSFRKARWIHSMFTALATSFHKIHGLLWYDVYARERGHVKAWPIETSKASSKAFKSGIGSTLERVCRGLGGSAKAQCLGK